MEEKSHPVGILDGKSGWIVANRLPLIYSPVENCYSALIQRQIRIW
ncbi:MAG: hypothetical protein HC879_11175 [Leptolyngbyaceae cyanobacterium SL_5_9]|nr:hypothetical protein [Leptolyngbyaceae cyanobacterium SL_5_9]